MEELNIFHAKDIKDIAPIQHHSPLSASAACLEKWWKIKPSVVVRQETRASVVPKNWQS